MRALVRLVALVPLILSAGRPKCAAGPVLPPADEFVLVNSQTGIQWTAGASNVTAWLSSFTWGGGSGTISSPFTMLYRNIIISTGADLDNLSVIETRDYSAATKAGWFDTNVAGRWDDVGADCQLTFTTSGWTIPGGSPNDEAYEFGTPLRAARGEFAFTLASDFEGNPITNKLMWLYVEGVGRVYVDINGEGAGPYTLNLNVQSTVNPGAQNYPPNIVPGASIERGSPFTLRFDVYGNSNATADGEMHLYYKAA